jgi:chemotaxis protein methyltransferase CheR
MPDLYALKRSIERLLFIQCSNYKEDYICRRLQSRMRLSGKQSYREYHSYLLSSRDEQELLRNALTINVTKFWRDKEVFTIIRREILPDIIRRKKRIRIWSAGCATGEEPYTIALIAYDNLRLHPDVSVTIYATDIDQTSIDRAKKGIYNQKALENLTPGQIRRHFNQISDNLFEVRPHLRQMIRFSTHDLMSGNPVTSYLDMVLCRNVTIYFTEEQKNELAKMVYGSLLGDGYYVMGKTEFLGRRVEDLFSPYNSIEKIYRKKS